LDTENKQVAILGQVASGEQLVSLPALMDKAAVVVMNAIDWQVMDLALYLIYSSYWILLGFPVELKISSVACRLHHHKTCSSTGTGAMGY